jgi:Salmonella virulence plasmid 65kDa B protein/FG-GAP-like repeat
MKTLLLAFAVVLSVAFAPPLFAQAEEEEALSPSVAESANLESAKAESISLAVNRADWSVTSSGAFTYSIPIAIPEGRRSIQPRLALVYSSLNGDGLAGYGWSLTGLPSIARANVKGAPRFDGHDSYIYDAEQWARAHSPGMKLTPITTGHYHTSRETHFDFIALGTCGDGPCGWAARDGAGRTFLFGGDAVECNDACLWEPVNRSGIGHRGILVWSLKSVVEELSQNSYTVSYDTTDGDRVLHPSAIIYTDHPTRAGTRRITFTYDPRPNISPPLFFAKVLRRITISAQSQLDRIYELGSEQSATSNRTLLSSVAFLDANGLPALPSIQLRYAEGYPINATRSLIRSSSVKTAHGPTEKTDEVSWFPSYLVGDFNGDGRADVMLVVANPNQKTLELSYAFGTIDGLGPMIGYYPFAPHNGYSIPVVGDFNGDGFDDLALVKVDGGTVATKVAYGGPAGLGPLVDSSNSTNIGFRARAVEAFDIDGDGRIDLVFVSELGPIAYVQGGQTGLGTISTLANPRVIQNVSPQLSFIDLAIGDFNGDGYNDLYTSFDPGRPMVALGQGVGLRARQTIAESGLA